MRMLGGRLWPHQNTWFELVLRQVREFIQIEFGLAAFASIDSKDFIKIHSKSIFDILVQHIQLSNQLMIGQKYGEFVYDILVCILFFVRLRP